MSAGVTELLGRLRLDQEQVLASRAPESAVIPPAFRVRSASGDLLLLGAGIGIGGADHHPEALRELAARVTLELAFALAPQGSDLSVTLDRLGRIQARRLPSLLLGRFPVGRIAAQRQVGIAFESLARMLGGLAIAPERPELAVEAADAANRIVLALSSLVPVQGGHGA